MPRHTRLALLACLACGQAHAADVKVTNAWARATAPGQPVAGAFMDLTANADTRLVAARSPASKTVELHTMSMAGGVMSMRQLSKIDLPKDKTVRLKPGGLHIMFIDLKAPLLADSTADLTLVLRDKRGKTSELDVTLPVRGMTDQPAGHASH